MTSPSPSCRRSEAGRVVLALLVLDVLVSYGYMLAPKWARPDVQNVCTAVAFVAFVLWVAWKVPGWTTIGACALWCGEMLLKAGCSIAYLARGAAATGDGEQCTGLLRFNFNSVGVFLLALLLVLTVRASTRCKRP